MHCGIAGAVEDDLSATGLSLPRIVGFPIALHRCEGRHDVVCGAVRQAGMDADGCEDMGVGGEQNVRHCPARRETCDEYAITAD